MKLGDPEYNIFKLGALLINSGSKLSANFVIKTAKVAFMVNENGSQWCTGLQQKILCFLNRSYNVIQTIKNRQKIFLNPNLNLKIATQGSTRRAQRSPLLKSKSLTRRLKRIDSATPKFLSEGQTYSAMASLASSIPPKCSGSVRVLANRKDPRFFGIIRDRGAISQSF